MVLCRRSERKSFNVIALDEAFNIVSLLRYTNLQWNRKYYETGTFSVQIPLEQYSSKIKYIYTKDRPELGIVSQLNYVNQSGYRNVQLSGYFLEKELGKRVVYPYAQVSNIRNAPAWIARAGNAESVAFAFFNAFKDIVYTDHHTPNDPPLYSYIGIDPGTDYGRGNETEQTRTGEELDKKIYSILKPSGMSYRVSYDFDKNKKIFQVWSGLDRRQEQSINNPIIFSTKYGNIKNPNIVISDTDYKNAVIECADFQNSSGEDITQVMVFGLYGRTSDYDDCFIYKNSGINRKDYDEDSFSDALQNEAFLELEKYVKNFNVEFDAMEGSYRYMTDFDLGDNVSIEIPEIDVSGEARLIGCYEVIKQGEWSLTMEFGEPIIK